MAPDATISPAAMSQKGQQLLTAAQTGNLRLLKMFAAQLDDGKGLAQTVADIKDAKKMGALHYAAGQGQINVCKYIVEELKLDIDAKDEDGETPLFHAAREHPKTAKYLIDCGANPSILSEVGTTALHHAAGVGDIKLLSLLLSKGVDVNSHSGTGTPLVWAAGLCQTDAVKFLLEHNADPNIENDDKFTALLASTTALSLPCLELLIQAGAKVNVAAYGSATPLHIAAHKGSPKIIKCLLKAGADPNAPEEDGYTPVQTAAGRGNRKAVEILLPVTSRVSAVPEWTVDGIIKYMQSGAVREQIRTEDKKKGAEAKSRGHDAFKNKDYMKAIDAYTQASDCDPTDATLPSNRSLCWLLLGKGEEALIEANACRMLRPCWPKACYREGAALRFLQKFDEAAKVFYEGVMLAPDNEELLNAFRETVEAGRKFHGTDEKRA